MRQVFSGHVWPLFGWWRVPASFKRVHKVDLHGVVVYIHGAMLNKKQVATVWSSGSGRKSRNEGLSAYSPKN